MSRWKMTSITAVVMSLILIADTALGAFTMTTPIFNSLVGTGTLGCGGATGGGSTAGLTIIVKDGSNGILGNGTAGPGVGGWSGTAAPIGGAYPSPGQVLNPILYDSALNPIASTYCHT